jgi:hypothetical protein
MCTVTFNGHYIESTACYAILNAAWGVLSISH